MFLIFDPQNGNVRHNYSLCRCILVYLVKFIFFSILKKKKKQFHATRTRQQFYSLVQLLLYQFAPKFTPNSSENFLAFTREDLLSTQLLKLYGIIKINSLNIKRHFSLSWLVLRPKWINLPCTVSQQNPNDIRPRTSSDVTLTG